jgi:HSP20 family protein
MVESSHTAGFWPSLYEPLRNIGSRIADFFAPASEAGSDDEGYQIDLELPGVKKEDIEISQHEQVLTVQGEKRSNREESKGSVFFCERQYGAFQRTFRLPPDADPGAISATYKDGLLSLRIPRKAPKEPAARKIEIGGS